MKKITLSIIAFLFLSCNNIQAQNEAFLRVSFGTNFLGTIGESPNYKVFGPSSINWIPSVRVESFPLLLETEDYDLYMMFGAGGTFYGYKHELTKDSISYQKNNGLAFLGGLGITSYLIEDLPISLTFNYQFMLFSNTKTYYDKVLISKRVNSNTSHALTGRLDFRLIDNLKFRLSAFYLADYYFKTTTNTSNNHNYLTQSLGISLSFSTGWYEPINL